MKTITQKVDTVLTEITMLIPRLTEPSQSHMNTCVDLLKEVKEAHSKMFKPAALVDLMTHEEQRDLAATLLGALTNDFAIETVVNYALEHGCTDEVIAELEGTS